MTDDMMPPRERDVTILRFLAEHNIALPATPLFYNLRKQEQITFSKKTLRRRLKSLEERDLLEYDDTGDGYYWITDAGREWLEGELSED